MSIPAQLKLMLDKHLCAHDIDLRSAELANSDLSSLSADRLDLRSVNLDKTKIQDARLSNCRFENATFEAAQCTGATFRMCVFDNARGAGACFDHARLEDSSAKGIDLTNASLKGAKLTETSFERAVLREAILDGAEGDGVEFRGADLGRASLKGVRFDEADFRGADLRGADLSHGRFHSSDFRGAILDGACFDGADCTGSWFDEGAGPYAETTSKAREKSPASPFDQFAVSALREGLGALPDILSGQGGGTFELVDEVRNRVEKLKAAANNPPEEWKPWLEPLMKMTQGGQELDIKVLLEALREGSTGLQNSLGQEAGSRVEIIHQLREMAAKLDTSGQPPDEWKSWLEPLMKMAQQGEPIEGKALLDALSALARNWQASSVTKR